MSCKQILPLTRSSVLALLLRIIISANGWHEKQGPVRHVVFERVNWY